MCARVGRFKGTRSRVRRRLATRMAWAEEQGRKRAAPHWSMRSAGTRARWALLLEIEYTIVLAAAAFGLWKAFNDDAVIVICAVMWVGVSVFLVGIARSPA